MIYENGATNHVMLRYRKCGTVGRLEGAQSSQNNKGSVVANNHLQWNIFHILTKKCTIEAHMRRPLIQTIFCDEINSSNIE
jgi:hypothetical protein